MSSFADAKDDIGRSIRLFSHVESIVHASMGTPSIVSFYKMAQ